MEPPVEPPEAGLFDEVRVTVRLGNSVPVAMRHYAMVTDEAFQAASDQLGRAQPQWRVAAFDKAKGNRLWQQELVGKPLPDGLLVDRGGQVIVTMLDGTIVCFREET